MPRLEGEVFFFGTAMVILEIGRPAPAVFKLKAGL
jgi:hypothetical protein